MLIHRPIAGASPPAKQVQPRQLQQGQVSDQQIQTEKRETTEDCLPELTPPSVPLCKEANGKSITETENPNFIPYVYHFDWEEDLPSHEGILLDRREIAAKKLGYFEDKLLWFLDKRNDWSERIASTGTSLDAYFAGQQSQTYTNSSFMRLRFGPTFAKFGSITAEPDIKFRLNLPLTKDKYRLVFESDPSEGKSLREKSQVNIVGDSNTDRENATGALRYIKQLAYGWKVTNDIGIKLRWPPDPFVRTKAENSWQLDENWQAQIRSSLHWFQSEQLGANLLLNMDRQLSSSLFFRSSSEIKWVKDEDVFEFGETLNLYQTISRKDVLRYRLGYLAESRPNPHTANFYFEVTYRHQLYRDWLFYEIIPAVDFPNDDSFKDNPSITFKLEVLFAQD